MRFRQVAGVLFCLTMVTWASAEDSPASGAVISSLIEEAVSAIESVAAEAVQVEAMIVEDFQPAFAGDGPAPAEDDEALKKDVVRRLRGALYSEVHFFDKSCQLTIEQREQLHKAAPQLRDQLGQKYLKFQKNMRVGRQVAADNPGHPRQVIRGLLAIHAEKIATPTQWAAYLAEVESTVRARKRSLAMLLTAKLESPLQLSTAQRQALFERLLAKWQPAWEETARLWMQNEGYYPALTADLFEGLLQKSQIEVWNGLQKFDSNFFWGDLGIEDGLGLQELKWFDDEQVVDVPLVNEEMEQ